MISSTFKKSQSSIEFLTIFGIGLLLIVIMSGIFFMYSGEAKSELDKQQIEIIGSELISNIEQIYFAGSGNRITLKSTFPQGIENFTIHHINNSKGEFDYLNITYIFDKQIISSIFLPTELYIRFNFSNSLNTPKINNNWISYFSGNNATSNYNGGVKSIRIESQGDFVSLEFIR